MTVKHDPTDYAYRFGRRAFPTGDAVDNRHETVPKSEPGRAERRLSLRAMANHRLRWVSLLSAAAGFVYTLHGWLRYDRFRSAGYDLGIFDQAIRHYAHFHAPLSAIKGPNYNLLGDHFHPILVSLAPIYWAWADPRVLSVVLAVLIASSAVPVYEFSQRRFGEHVALAVVAGYLLWWPMQTIVDFDFHEVAFAVPIVAWLINSLDQRKFRTVVSLCLLLLLVREDMGFVVLMTAVIVAINGRKRLACTLGFVGLSAYYVVTSLIVPFFSKTGSWVYWDYPALGANPSDAIIHIFRHPWSTAILLVSTKAKQGLLLYLFLPFGLFGLASPYLLLAAPIIFERLFSSRENLWGTSFHYNAILGPIFVLAMVDTIGRLLVKRRSSVWVRWVPAVLLCGSVIVGMLVGGPYPTRALAGRTMWATTPHMRDQAAAVRAVPPGVCVEADDRLIPHLVRTDWVTTPLNSGGHATWMALDLSQKNTGGTDIKPAAALSTAKAAGFSEIFTAGTMVVLKRPGQVDPICKNIS